MNNSEAKDAVWSLNRSRALERMNRYLLRSQFYRGHLPEELKAEFVQRSAFWKDYSTHVGDCEMRKMIPLALRDEDEEWDFTGSKTEENEEEERGR